jgi:hypothetical protein
MCSKRPNKGENAKKMLIFWIFEKLVGYSSVLVSNSYRMARKKKDKIKELKPKIKVRLDHKTVITVRDMAKFEFWKEKFPNAVIIS